MRTLISELFGLILCDSVCCDDSEPPVIESPPCAIFSFLTHSDTVSISLHLFVFPEDRGRNDSKKA